MPPVWTPTAIFVKSSDVAAVRQTVGTARPAACAAKLAPESVDSQRSPEAVVESQLMISEPSALDATPCQRAAVGDPVGVSQVVPPSVVSVFCFVLCCLVLEDSE